MVVDPSNEGFTTDHSGEITTGGASQEVMPANSNRDYLLIQNVSAENLWVNLGADANADQPSIKLVPDGHMEYEGSWVPSDDVHIFGASTGSSFTAKEG